MIVSSLLSGQNPKKERLEEIANNLNVELGAVGEEGVVMVSSEWAVAVEYSENSGWTEVWECERENDYTWNLLKTGLNKLDKTNEGFLIGKQRASPKGIPVLRESIEGPPIIVNGIEKTVFYENGTQCQNCFKTAVGVLIPMYGSILTASPEGKAMCESCVEDIDRDMSDPELEFRRFNG